MEWGRYAVEFDPCVVFRCAMMSIFLRTRVHVLPVISSLLVGVLTLGPVAAQEMSYSGMALYVENCSACHGVYGGGDGPVAGILAVSVPDLRLIAERAGGTFPRDRVYYTVDGRELGTPAHGDRRMPIWGKAFWLEEGADDQAETRVTARIEALVEFLVSIQAPRPTLRE